MNARRRNGGIALFALALVLGLPLFAKAIAQRTAVSPASHTPSPAVQPASTESRAHSIALERYWFLKRLVPKVGIGFPLYTMIGDTDCTVLFPIGKSNRVYLSVWLGYGSTGEPIDAVFCYQRNNGKDKLVYRVNIESKDRLETKASPAKTTERTTSLLDYLTGNETTYGRGVEDVKYVQSYSLARGTSISVKKDLAIKRDYAQYSYYPVIDTLRVLLLSDLRNGQPPDGGDEGPDEGFYNLDEDPFTKAKLKTNENYENDEFLIKYGLPAAKGELMLINDAL